MIEFDIVERKKLWFDFGSFGYFFMFIFISTIVILLVMLFGLNAMFASSFIIFGFIIIFNFFILNFHKIFINYSIVGKVCFSHEICMINYDGRQSIELLSFSAILEYHALRGESINGKLPLSDGITKLKIEAGDKQVEMLVLLDSYDKYQYYKAIKNCL